MASAASALRSSTESFPSFGNSQSGIILHSASRMKVERPIPNAIAHYFPSSPLGLHLKTRLPKVVMITCPPMITSQRTIKVAFVWRPSKMFHSSWTFLQQIMLKTCISTKEVKMNVKCLEAPYTLSISLVYKGRSYQSLALPG